MSKFKEKMKAAGQQSEQARRVNEALETANRRLEEVTKRLNDKLDEKERRSAMRLAR